MTGATGGYKRYQVAAENRYVRVSLGIHTQNSYTVHTHMHTPKLDVDSREIPPRLLTNGTLQVQGVELLLSSAAA